MTPPPASPAPPPTVSVLLPTFKQAAFVRRAIDSLCAQFFTAWEAIVVDDGSPDDTAALVAPYLADPRFHLVRLPHNAGLGHALNVGLDRSRGQFVAYLPTDDVWYAEHLASLLETLDATPEAVLAYAGVRHYYNRVALGRVPGEPLQLVQVLHRRTARRWLERRELTTDDLDRMFWDRLRREGTEIGSGRVTCEWVDHPDQRHTLLREPEGGINRYRRYYGVREPLRVQTTVGNLIDEVARYRRFRRPPAPPVVGGLRILLVGELAYNADRILALEERGHRLYGLWLERPYWYNTVGPLPFGHVEDIPFASWREAVCRIRPDVIYALLNWQAVPFAHAILEQNPGIPFVWHFKEGPFICLEKGTWPEMVELYERADAGIYSSPEMRDWFATVAPEAVRSKPTLVLDGDLPKRDWFGQDRSPRLSDEDGAIHTVVPGRPIGLHPETVAELAAEDIHLHFYGDFTQGQWRAWIDRTRGLAPGHLHLHPHVDQERWTAEFSRYDAGWLHGFRSENGGEIRRANWDDLNYPARMACLAAAGLPMVQMDNPGAVVATQNLVRRFDLGLFYESIPDLAAQLRDGARLATLRANVWREREQFTFDAHADDLIAFFRSVILASGHSTPVGLARRPLTRFGRPLTLPPRLPSS